MATTGQRIQNWQVLRPLGKVGRNNKYIEIPAFSQQCFKTNASLHLPATQNAPISTSQSVSGHTGFMFEAWILNHAVQDDVEQIIAYNKMTIGGLQWRIGIVNHKLRVTFVSGSFEVYTETSVDVPEGEWCHIAFSRDSNGNLQKFYINGVMVDDNSPDIPVNIVFDESPNNIYAFVLGSGYDLSKMFLGNIAEVRYWSAPQSDDDVLAKYNSPRDISQTIDTELVWYISMSSLLLDNPKEEISDTLAISTVGDVQVVNDEYPPLVYGSSFVPVIFHVISTIPHSLRFPVEVPEDANFGLTVAWTDSNGEFQRKYLHLPEGVSINPVPEEYRGDNLPVDYDIEIWNIDGNDDVTSANTITLVTSVTTPMESITDTVPQVLTTPTQDVDIFEPLPFASFPLQFNSPTTY